MTEPNAGTSRRGFLRATAGAATVTAATGTATAQEETDSGGGGGGNVQPDFGGYLSDANGYGGSATDLRGQGEVTIEVGAGSDGLAFSPAAVWVDPGTTIVWEWTGNGGDHNVVGDNGEFSSGDAVGEAGYTYEQSFEESQIVNYYCRPHQQLGMLGAVAVGDDIETVTTGGGGGGGGEPDPEHMGVPFQAHFVGLATLLMIAVSFVFTFFFLKYGESSHTKGGSN